MSAVNNYEITIFFKSDGRKSRNIYFNFSQVYKILPCECLLRIPDNKYNYIINFLNANINQINLIKNAFVYYFNFF